MPIAKQNLSIGTVTVARPGNFVAASAVERYGWHDKVAPDGRWDFLHPSVDVELPEQPPEPKRRGRRKTA